MMKVQPGLIPYLLLVAYLGVTIYTANQVSIGVWEYFGLRLLLYLAIGIIFFLGLFVLFEAQLAFIVSQGIQTEVPVSELPSISPELAIASVIFAFITGSICVGVLNFEGVRLTIARLAGSKNNYNPESPIHLTAVVLMCFLLTGIIVLFVLTGGLEGMAESIQSVGIDPVETIVTAVLEVSAAAMGVGYAIRRTERQTLDRLGLQIPTYRQVMTGIFSGIGFYLVATIFAVVWTAITSPEQLQQQSQAAEQVTLALSNLPMALLVSVCAAIGEEILMRGALQPVPSGKKF
jgi:membrane protease YdiL (CAAX protease family)